MDFSNVNFNTFRDDGNASNAGNGSNDDAGVNKINHVNQINQINHVNQVNKKTDQLEIYKSFFSKHKDTFKYCKGTLYVLWEHVWICNKKTRVAVIHNYMLKFGLNPNSQWGGCMKVINALALEHCKDDNFQLTLQTSSRLKLPFKDGIYDFTTKKFTKFKDLKKTVFLDFKLSYKFPKRPSPERMQHCLDKVFKPIFDNDDELMKEVLTVFSCCIAGVTMKVWITAIGERHSGKGIITDSYGFAFEDLVGTISSGTFTNSKTRGEESRFLYKLSPFCDHRLVFGNELADKNKSLDGNLFKQIGSGGDKVTYRGLYENEITRKLMGKLVLLTNDITNVKPVDAYQTMLHFTFPCEFRTEGEENECVKKFRLADDDLRDYVQENKDYRDELVHLTLDYYDPKFKYTKLKQNVVSLTEDNDEARTDISKLDDIFEFTDNLTDILGANDCLNYVKMADTDITSSSKLKSYLLKKGAIHSSKLTPKKKDINGKRVSYYSKIKMITHVPENDVGIENFRAD